MHGGQAIPAFDFYLAPYVRNSFIEEVKVLEEITGEDYKHLYHFPIKDYVRIELDGLSGDERVLQHAINRTVSRVHQSMEAFIHNMNTIHSRGGNQVVFSSVNYGTDTSAEGRCIIREMLTSTYRGVGSGGTAIFPIQIWKKKRGVNYLPQDPNYDLYVFACKSVPGVFFPTSSTWTLLLTGMNCGKPTIRSVFAMRRLPWDAGPGFLKTASERRLPSVGEIFLSRR